MLFHQVRISDTTLDVQLMAQRYQMNIFTSVIVIFVFTDSPFRTPISSAILQLQEGGQLHIIKEKWWKNKHGGGKCNKVRFYII